MALEESPFRFFQGMFVHLIPTLKASLRSWLPALAVCALAACGGGGGGDPAVAPPVITQQPASVSVQAGAPASFSVGVQSAAPANYQWLRNGAEVAGAQSSTYTLASAALSDSGSSWSVRVANAGGAVTSSAASLAVAAAPAGPPGLSIFLGGRPGSGAVDGAGRDARFGLVSDMSLGADGNLYIAERNAISTLRQVSPAGVVTSITSTNNDCAGGPTSVAAANDGSLYVRFSLDDFVYLGICRRAPDGTWTKVLPQPDALGGAYYLTRARGNGIYVATGTRIYRYDPASGLRLIAGLEASSSVSVQDGVGTNARFVNIGDITADAAGTLYVVDRGYGIRKVTEDSTVTTLARGAYEKVAVDAAGNLAVLQAGTASVPGRLRRITPTGQDVALPGSDQLPAGTRPVGLDYGGAGQLYYATTQGIGTLSADGTPGLLAGRMEGEANAFEGSIPLGVDGQGNVVTISAPALFAIDPVAPFVLRKFSAAGQPLSYGPAGALTFPEKPTDAAMDLAGNVYLAYARFQNPFSSADRGSPTTSELYKITPEGSVSRLYNSARGAAGFVSPVVIAVDDQGTLYLGDSSTNTLRKLLADGSTAVVAQGNFNANLPSTIAVTPSGTVYLGVPDHSIVRINADGSSTVVAGLPGAPTASVDGTGGAARFQSSVLTLVPDAAGNLYVGDYDTIRKVTPAGVVTTVAGTAGHFTFREGPLPGATGYVGPFAGGSFRDPNRSAYLEGLVGRGNTLYYQTGVTAIARVQLP